MKRISILLLLAFAFGFLFIARTTMAQDATLEAAPVSIVTAEPDGSMTVEDGGTVIVIEQPTETPVPPVEAPSFLTSILEFILGAIVGAGVALGSAAAWIRSAMNDPVKMTLAETAARNISPETLKQILDFLKTAQDFAIEATDDVPMITKPKPVPPANPTAYTSTSSTNQDQM